MNNQISYDTKSAIQFENDRQSKKDPTQVVMSSLYVLSMLLNY